MTFRTLCEYLHRIESVSSRLEMTDILAELFSNCTESEVAISCYLINARVAPLFIPIEFRVAEKTLMRVVETVVGSNRRGEIADAFQRVGDLGEVIEELGNKRKAHNIEDVSVHNIYDKLWDIALLEGTGSSERRMQLIAESLGSVSPLEAKYVMRILSQKLRLGSGSKTILDALSVGRSGDKSDRDELERAYGVCADLGYISQVYRKSGVEGLSKITVTPGVPVFPMLVEREKDSQSIMERIPRAIVQPKFDGIRCQIHIGVQDEEKLSDRVWWSMWKSRKSIRTLSLFGESTIPKDVRLFSRNLEDMTDMFPDVVEAASKLNVKTAVFDSEVVGFDEKTGKYVPFQETMTRKRKYNVLRQVGEVPVRAFIFDVLMLDGKVMIEKSNCERIEHLTHIVIQEGVIRGASSHTVTTARMLEKIFKENIKSGLEGVVVKSIPSHYEPGVRSLSWIKLKRASQGNLADTVDVVILGYYHGRGKQSKLGIGALLGGVYDKENDRYVTLTKIGTGITEERWRTIKDDLERLVISEPPNNVIVNRMLKPHVWVKPSIVATVEADEITRSPIHTAGAGSDGIGYALRFPRLKDWGRDRVAEDATLVSEVKRMYTESKLPEKRI